MMHIIVEHMFLEWNNYHMHAGTRVSCDHGLSWIVDCKLSEGLIFDKDQVTSFETRRRVVEFSEYKARLHRNLKYGMRKS